MKLIYAPLLAVLSIVTPLCSAQTTIKNPLQDVIHTDICQILSKPYAYNNKIVRVRGHLSLNWEYSLFIGDHCDALWLESFGEEIVPPQLIAIVSGSGTSGGKDTKGRQTPPVPIHLVRDSNWVQLEYYLKQNARAAMCMEGPAPDLSHLSDCNSYRITVTFTGRIDAISKSVYQLRRKQKDKGIVDRKGFGQMGMFDAQIVVKSVEDVVATDESEIGKTLTAKPH